MKYNAHYIERNPHEGRGRPSRTRPGEEEYETHAGSKVYHEGGHEEVIEPYGKRRRVRRNPRIRNQGRGQSRVRTPQRDDPASMAGIGGPGGVGVGGGPVSMESVHPNNLIAYRQGFYFGYEEGLRTCPLYDLDPGRMRRVAMWLATSSEYRARLAEFQEAVDDMDEKHEASRRERQFRILRGIEGGMGAQIPTVGAKAAK